MRTNKLIIKSLARTNENATKTNRPVRRTRRVSESDVEIPNLGPASEWLTQNTKFGVKMYENGAVRFDELSSSQDEVIFYLVSKIVEEAAGDGNLHNYVSEVVKLAPRRERYYEEVTTKEPEGSILCSATASVSGDLGVTVDIEGDAQSIEFMDMIIYLFMLLENKYGKSIVEVGTIITDRLLPTSASESLTPRTNRRNRRTNESEVKEEMDTNKVTKTTPKEVKTTKMDKMGVARELLDFMDKHNVRSINVSKDVLTSKLESAKKDK